MAKHLELGESSLQKLRRLRIPKSFIKPEMFQTTFQAQINYFLDKRNATFSRQKHFPGKYPSVAFAKFEVMLKGERSTFGTSAETRGTVSLAMVKEEECSNLSLLSGVRKHAEEVMKNSPKQEKGDLVSIPWGRLSSSREGGKENREKLEGKMNEQKLRVAWLFGVFFSLSHLQWLL